MSLIVVPITLRTANEYVKQNHRHHGSTVGHKFSIGVKDGAGTLVGVAVAGRPVSRMLDDGLTLEVLRVATDGSRNACSMLYGAMRRIAVAMGYPSWRVFTYILESEAGVSLHAAGWVKSAIRSDGGSWSREKRPRMDGHPLVPKIRYQAGPDPGPSSFL